MYRHPLRIAYWAVCHRHIDTAQSGNYVRAGSDYYARRVTNLIRDFVGLPSRQRYQVTKAPLPGYSHNPGIPIRTPAKIFLY